MTAAAVIFYTKEGGVGGGGDDLLTCICVVADGSADPEGVQRTLRQSTAQCSYEALWHVIVHLTDPFFCCRIQLDFARNNVLI